MSALCADSTDAARTPGLRLNGSARLSLDAPTQTGARFRLKAMLAPAHAATAPRPQQDGGGFLLRASLAAMPLVCANDDIFRDDFDGDGF